MGEGGREKGKERRGEWGREGERGVRAEEVELKW